jgi:cell division protein FtsQ
MSTARGGWRSGRSDRRTASVLSVRTPSRGNRRGGASRGRTGPRVPPAVWRGLAFGGLAALVVTLAVFVTRESSRQIFDRNSRFTLRVLDVATDGKLSADLLIQYAGVQTGTNLFQVDLKEVRRRLADVPLVESVRVRRVLPDVLSIRVVERVALARAPVAGGSYYHALARDGFVIGPSAAAPHLPSIIGLPTETIVPGRRVEGRDAEDALALLDLCDRTALGMNIGLRAVDVTDPETLVLRMERGDRAVLPRARMEVSLRRLVAALRAIEMEQMRGAGAVELDLRGERVVVGTGLRTL